MDIILPAAGLGSRLRPITWSRPKPLVGLAGAAILDHVLAPVWELSPSRLIFITGYLGDQIVSYANQHYEVPISYVEQPEMLGQSDAIARTRGLATGAGMMIFPDAIFAGDFSIITTTDADAVMFVKYVDDPSALGVAVVEGDRIVRLVEKPQEPVSHLAIVGINWFRSMPDLYSAIDEQIERNLTLKGEFFIADAIQIMIDRGAKIVPATLALWEDCGNVPNLLSSNRILLERLAPQPVEREKCLILSPSFVSPEAIVERSVIGPFASVAAHAVVRNAVVRDCIIESGAVVEDCMVEHSIVGQNSQVRGRQARVVVVDNGVVSL